MSPEVALIELLTKRDAEIERLRADFAALQYALVGNTGLSAIQEAHRLRKLHPLGINEQQPPKPDPNIIHPGKDPDFVFPEENT